jgi:uncharacterized membrane protein YbhN (UPF0104 family)
LLATSAFNAYVGSLLFLAMLPLALGYFMWSQPLNAQQTAGGILLMVLVGLGFLVATAVILSSPVRRWLRGQLAHVIRWVRKGRDDGAQGLATFDAALTRGMEAVRRHPEELIYLLLVTACDWFSAMICLGFCFQRWHAPAVCRVAHRQRAGAFGGPGLHDPGGLGIQEGSMAAYHSLWHLVEQATLASVLFRVIYYFVPLAISLVFYRRLAGSSAKTMLEGEAPASKDG